MKYLLKAIVKYCIEQNFGKVKLWQLEESMVNTQIGHGNCDKKLID